MPKNITFPDSGEIDTIATCEEPGPIVADIGDISGIYTPTYGWNGITNTEAAELGTNTEDDIKLRKRQSQSTAQPSNTMLEGTSGAIAELKGVTRSKVYENDTNQTDKRGLPAHSITAVVEGGNNEEIAKAIWSHKGIGCYTNGDIETNVIDSKKQVTPIRYFKPNYIYIYVVVNIKTLDGYTTAITENIKKNIETYLNSLDIGSKLTVSALWGIALQAMESLINPTFSITSITAGTTLENQSTDDIQLQFNEVFRGSKNNVVANIS